MAGSKSSSWATQSASSSRQLGPSIPEPSSPVRRDKTAGTCPVGGSVQWGSSVGVPLGTAVWPGLTGWTVGPAAPGAAGWSVKRTADCSSSSSSGTGPPRSSSPSSSPSGSSRLVTLGSSPVTSPAGSAPMIRTWPVGGLAGSGRAGGRSVRVTSSFRQSGTSSTQLSPPIDRADGDPIPVRSRGAPAPCGPAAVRWRPPGPE